LAVTSVTDPEILPNVTATAISAPGAAINDDEATRSVEASRLVGRKDMDVAADGPGKKGAYSMWSRFNLNDYAYKD
jgi:hypothetical protein